MAPTCAGVTITTAVLVRVGDIVWLFFLSLIYSGEVYKICNCYLSSNNNVSASCAYWGCKSCNLAVTLVYSTALMFVSSIFLKKMPATAVQVCTLHAAYAV